MVPLHRAAEEGRCEILRYLFGDAVHIDTTDDKGVGI